MGVEEEVRQITEGIEVLDKKLREAPHVLIQYEKLLDEADEIDPVAGYWSAEAEDRTRNQRYFWLGQIREEIATRILGMDPDNLKALYTLYYVYEAQEFDGNFWIMERIAELDPEHPFADVVADVYAGCYEKTAADLLPDLGFLERAVKFYSFFVNSEGKRIERFQSSPGYVPSGSSARKAEALEKYKKKRGFYGIELQALSRVIFAEDQYSQ